jgi:acetyltransferase-like isoleucine patch superfamily enzyme
VLLAGAHKISIGERSSVLTGCWVSAARRTWPRPGPAIVIGDRVRIRPFCTLSSAESVVIEDDVTIGSYSMIVDSHHKLDGPHDNPGRNPPISAPIRIGRGTQIGERVAVLRGSTIGRACVIATNSVVQGRIPDYSIVSGAPARIVGRRRPAGLPPP